MAYFSYKARDAKGELQEGVMESTDEQSVVSRLFNQNLTPVDIQEAAGPIDEAMKGGEVSRFFGKKVTSLDVQLFSRQIYTLIKSGVPIMRGLSGLQESCVNPAFTKVIQNVRESLDSGYELSNAMSKHPKAFTNFYLSMIRVGEMTGRLDEIFLRLSEHLEFERDMRNRVKTALRYPIFVVAVMLIAIVIVNIFVIPQFSNVFASFGAKLPFLTQMLLNTSNFFVQYWWLVGAIIMSGILLFVKFIHTKSGRMWWDSAILKAPIFGTIILKATLARFARSFALAARSGVPLVQGLSVVSQTVDNVFIASRLEKMREGVERGDSILKTAANAKIFTPIVLQMIAVGEETGALDELMDEVAGMYESEVDYELKTLSSNIEPILIVILGIMVLILALGIFLPIWDLGKVALRKN